MEDLRRQLEGLEIEALENFIAAQRQQATTSGFMGRGFAAGAVAQERHLERLQIAHEVLAERYKVAAEMVQEAYFEQMENQM